MKFIKKILNRIPFLFKTAKWLQFNVRKIFLGYRRYPGIPGRIHFNDRSLIKNNTLHYKAVGKSAVRFIESAVDQSGITLDDKSCILDFPCGYGRVLRYLKKKFPHAHVYGGDIDKEALDFCEKEFNIIPIPSNINFGKIKFPVLYNLIWVGSLFTHIDFKDFCELLKTLMASLKEKGILVFTTHGKESLNKLNSYGLDNLNPDLIKHQIEKEGFCFQPYPGKSNYGISISTQGFVMETMNQIFQNKVRFIFFKHKGWDQHQDVFAVQKMMI